MDHTIKNFFYPSSICLVGASTKEKSIGYELLKTISKYGYNGVLFPVNPKADSILGYKCYKSIEEINDTIDLAIIVVPKQFVEDSIDTLLSKDVKSILLITAGFREVGEEGEEVENRIVEKIKDAVRYVTGQEVVSVIAAGSALGFPGIADAGDVATAVAILTMSGGTLAQLSALRHDPVGYDVRLEVFASGDSVAAGWSDRAPIRSAEPGVPGPADPIVTMWDRFDAAFRAEMEAFVRVVVDGEVPASNPHDAYQDLRVAFACDRSLAEGRTVNMEEIE